MSSILEALRELEEDRGRGAPKRTTSVADAPREPGTSLGAFIPLTGGLAIGILTFGLWVWSGGWRSATPPGEAASEAPAPSAALPAPAASAPPTPAWLETAEAPRARITPPPAPVGVDPAPVPRAAASPSVAAAPTPELPLPKVTAKRDARGFHQVDIESIRFSPSVDQRTVTLRVNGQRATLRQRESLGDVEVQLIMSDGVYIQRNAEVFFLTPSR